MSAHTVTHLPAFFFHRRETSGWDPRRYFEWRRYGSYSGGISTNLFIHRVTRIIKAVGLTFPDRVVATGGTWNFTDTLAEIPETFNMLCDYPGGPTVALISSMANSTPIEHVIRGHKATLEFNREGFVITPEEIAGEAGTDSEERRARDVSLLVYRKNGSKDVALHHRNLHSAIQKGRN